MTRTLEPPQLDSSRTYPRFKTRSTGSPAPFSPVQISLSVAFAFVVLSLLVLAFVALAGPEDEAGNASPADPNNGAEPAEVDPLSSKELEVLDNLSSAFEHVATQLEPSVVSITATRTIRSSSSRQQIPDQLREFFGDDFFNRFQQQQAPGNSQQRGGGTGVIVSKDGYIMTNAHVVRMADEVEITLADERKLTAEIIGRDDKTDIAVLKVDADDLVPARLGDSDRTRVGQWVMAFGSPFGLHQTVTAGIISATGRDSVGIAEYEDFLQSDAAINPGNSGGPLVNLRGEVIGINTAIASRSGGYMGIGFAIPVNMASEIRDELIANGEVQRGRLGILIQEMTPELAESFNFDSTRGALIGDVMKDGPADKAGLKAGDIVTQFGDSTIHSVTQLRNLVASTQPGSNVDVTVFRNGTSQTIKVEVGELLNDSTAATTSRPQQATEVAGLNVKTLTEDLRRQIGASQDIEGVVVTAVQPNSLAYERGLRPGDVIMEINSQSVTSAEDFEEQVNDESLAEGIRLSVARQGTRRFVFLKTNGD